MSDHEIACFVPDLLALQRTFAREEFLVDSSFNSNKANLDLHFPSDDIVTALKHYTRLHRDQSQDS